MPESPTNSDEEPTAIEWAQATATRIADEWSGSGDFPEDALLLKKCLTKLFILHSDICAQLIGTGIIEESYFEDLD